MSRWDEERNYHCAEVDSNYIQKCWNDFTTLTEEEFKTLKKIIFTKTRGYQDYI